MAVMGWFVGSGGNVIEHAGAASGSGLGSLCGSRSRCGHLCGSGCCGGDLRRGYLHGAQAFEVCQAFEEAGEGCGGVFFHGLTISACGDGKNVVLRGGERYKFYAVHGDNINAAS